MGISYQHRRIIGVYIYGQIDDLYEFLGQQGYVLDKNQQEEIYANGDPKTDLIEMFKLEGMEIVNVDHWSGHDYVIGYEVGRKMSQKVAKEKFANYFPDVTPELQDFTEIS